MQAASSQEAVLIANKNVPGYSRPDERLRELLPLRKNCNRVAARQEARNRGAPVPQEEVPETLVSCPFSLGEYLPVVFSREVCEVLVLNSV